MKRMTSRTFALLVAGMVLGGCHTARNYSEPLGPRYAGGEAPRAGDPAIGPDTLVVGSFNIEYGREIDSALVVIRSDPHLADADILLLQEMDAEGTRRIAEALGMAWVYYPATLRFKSGRDFGNAILSRWPIVDDAKLVLPHLAIFGASLRTATRATVRVGRMDVQVYSVHLATPVNQALEDRRDQMRAILHDASRFPHVVIGGDFNSDSLARMALERGYAWPTREGPHTVTLARLDHVVFKGLTPPSVDASGTILDVRRASDHRPVWARGVLR